MATGRARALTTDTIDVAFFRHETFFVATHSKSTMLLESHS
jgi:hypothetical protein